MKHFNFGNESKAQIASQKGNFGAWILSMLVVMIMVFGLPQSARADNATALATQINGFTGGVGSLSAVAVSDVVTVTGSVTGATSALTLNIDAGVTVVWRAIFTGAATYSPGATVGLITLDGNGTFKMDDADALVSCFRNAIWVAGSNNVIIEDGTVRTTANTAGIAIQLQGGATFPSLTVSGGLVEATGAIGGGTAINASNSPNNNIVINGGKIFAKTGLALAVQSAKLAITGGVVYAYGASLSNVITGGRVAPYGPTNPFTIGDIGANATVIAWNKDANNTTYDICDDADLTYSSKGTVGWCMQGGAYGIYYNTGFIPVPQVTMLGSPLAGYINTTSGGALIATLDATDNILFVDGSWENVSTALTLDIPECLTVVWRAVFTGAATYSPGATVGLITLDGKGTFKMDDEDALVSCFRNAIWVIGYNNVIIEKGTVRTTAKTAGSAIRLQGSTNPAIKQSLTVLGGLIEATIGGNAISASNTPNNTIIINGGQILAKTKLAVAVQSTRLTITSGAVFAYGTSLMGDVITGGRVAPYGPTNLFTINDVDGDAVVIAWDQVSSTGTYFLGSSDDLTWEPNPDAKVWWDIHPILGNGISYENGSNTGFIPLPVDIIEKPSVTITYNGNPIGTLVNLCEGEELELEFQGLLPITLNYWRNGSSGSIVVTTELERIQTITEAPGAYLYMFTSLVDGNGTTGTVPGIAIITVRPTPALTSVTYGVSNAPITGTNPLITLCEDDAILKFNFTGIPPYVLYYTLNGTPSSFTSWTGTESMTLAPSSSIYNFVLLKLTGGGYSNLGLDGCQMDLNQQFRVRVNATPTVTFSNGGQTITTNEIDLCHNELIRVDFTGRPPFTLEYEVDGVPAQVTTIPIIGYTTYITVKAENAPSVYTFGRVTDNNGCTANLDLTVNVLPRPEIISIICKDGTPLGKTGHLFYGNLCQYEEVTVNFKGEPPFTFSYTVGGATTTETTSDMFAKIELNTAGAFSYTLNLEDDYCTSLTPAMMAITVRQTPKLELYHLKNDIRTDIEDGKTYTFCENDEITFEFSGGTVPYTVNYTMNNTIETITSWTSSYTIKLGADTPQDFTLNTFTSLLSCDGLEHSGIHNFTINVRPLPKVTFSYSGGEIKDGDVVELCQNERITLTFTGKPAFKLNYEIDGIASQINTLPIIGYTAYITANDSHTYTFIKLTDANNNCPNENFAEFTTIVHPRPEIVSITHEDLTPLGKKGNLFYALDICQYEELTVNFEGEPPFIFSYTVGGVTTIQDPIDAMFTTIQIPSAGAFSYTLNVEDKYCTNRTSSLMTITVRQTPILTLIYDDTIIENGETYSFCQYDTITAKFSGGTPPYILNYSIDGVAQQPPIISLGEDKRIILSEVDAVGLTYTLNTFTSTLSCDGIKIDEFTAIVLPRTTLAMDNNADPALADPAGETLYCIAHHDPYDFGIATVAGCNEGKQVLATIRLSDPAVADEIEVYYWQNDYTTDPMLGPLVFDINGETIFDPAAPSTGFILGDRTSYFRIVNLGNAVIDIPFNVEIELYEVATDKILATYTIDDMILFACPEPIDIQIKCPENGWIYVNETTQLELELTPFNAYIQDLTFIWNSSNPNTAIIDQEGKITGMMRGVTDVTLVTTDGKFSSACHIRVIQPVEDIWLNKEELSLPVGSEETLIALVLPENADVKDVIWNSADPTIATVDATGKVTGIQVGTTTITVTSAENDLITKTCVVTVVESYAMPTGITIDPKTLSLNRGADSLLIATLTPVGANPAVTWNSSSPTIATVDATGRVHALAAGKTTITAKTINGFSATCAVTVVVGIDSIVIDPKTCTLPFKGAKALKATVYPSDASNKTLVWSSSDITIATVSATGTVTAKSVNGTVEIRATNAASGKYGICTVIVGTGSPAPMDITEIDGNDIVVYPNPTSGKLTIANPESRITSYEVFNVVGQSVKTNMNPNDTEDTSRIHLDISDLPTGVYFIRLQTESKMVTKKIVKE